MSISIGALVSLLMVIFSKSADVGGVVRGLPQSPATPAAVRRPPRRCWRNWASLNEAWV
jgi:hypothetical protein